MLRVRMGMHTGEPVLSDEGRYHGMGVHRTARIMAAGHGGQILASQSTASVLADDDLDDISLRDLGEHNLKDLAHPERIVCYLAAWRSGFTFVPRTPAAAPTGSQLRPLTAFHIRELRVLPRRGAPLSIRSVFAWAKRNRVAGMWSTHGSAGVRPRVREREGHGPSICQLFVHKRLSSPVRWRR